MLDRLEAFEKLRGWEPEFSTRYRPLVDAANRNRMMYAVYHKNRRPELLENVRKGLLDGKEQERAILCDFIQKTEETT